MKIHLQIYKRKVSNKSRLFFLLVTSTGFEPVNAALRGLRLKPLVDEAKKVAFVVYLNKATKSSLIRLK